MHTKVNHSFIPSVI